ncbi:MAG: Na+/H+ antiporter subunit E [Cyanobacteria bacterium P01_F01_bin.3]
MIGYRDLLLRLTIWFLLTADLSWANILVGIVISLLLPKFGPRSYIAPAVLKDWLQILWETVVAIPRAYIEAFEMMLSPHTEEELTVVPSRPRRTPGLLFLDIFLITFTPKSIVVKHYEEGRHEVHWVRRRKRR